jgi:hypothetical protein
MIDTSRVWSHHRFKRRADWCFSFFAPFLQSFGRDLDAFGACNFQCCHTVMTFLGVVVLGLDGLGQGSPYR